MASIYGRPLCAPCASRRGGGDAVQTGGGAFTLGYSVFSAACERERQTQEALHGLAPRFEADASQRLLEQAAVGGPGFEASCRAMEHEILDMQRATAEAQARTIAHIEQIVAFLEPLAAIVVERLMVEQAKAIDENGYKN